MGIRSVAELVAAAAISLTLLVGLGSVSAQSSETLNVGGNDELGNFVVAADGLTLYIFTPDPPGESVCTDQCAINWPPLTVAEGEEPTVAEGVPGVAGVTVREDGSRQVTLDDRPLYYFAADSAPGDSSGQGVGDVWFVVQIESATESDAQSGPTIGVGGNSDLGEFLVAGNGLTLYTFDPDPPGESACTDQCAINWPPLTVAEGEVPTAGPGVAGTLGVITRGDGSQQVTLDDRPLYFYMSDAAPGDALGQGLGDVWFVISVGATSDGDTQPAVAPPAAGNAGLLDGPAATSVALAIAGALLAVIAIGGARVATSMRRR